MGSWLAGLNQRIVPSEETGVAAALRAGSPALLPYHRERARQLVAWAGGEGEAPAPADRLGRLIVEQWGRREERRDLDESWCAVWSAAAEGIAITPPWWTSDIALDERGEEIDLAQELHRFFRSPRMRHVFRSGESFRAHVAQLDTGDPRAYLYCEQPYKRTLDVPPRFTLCAPNAVYYFGLGNYVRNCMAFHADRCDNSDIVFSYLFDGAILALELYTQYRAAGQVWLVLGTDDEGRRVLVVDSAELQAQTRAAMRGLVDPIRRACSAVASRLGAEAVLVNTRVYTTSAALFVSHRLGELALEHRVVRATGPGQPRVQLGSGAAVRRFRFRKSEPWSRGAAILRGLGVTRRRCYLDSWGGFVAETHDEGEMTGVPL